MELHLPYVAGVRVGQTWDGYARGFMFYLGPVRMSVTRDRHGLWFRGSLWWNAPAATWDIKVR